jgi:tRNA-specific 2-thiouridylase
LPNHAKKDSQGVCLIGPLDMKEFLTSYIKPKKGRILDLHNKVIGTHDGVYYYTLGQRHGLDIKNGHGPYYVVKKDIKKNIIYVGTDKEVEEEKAQVQGISWALPPKLPRILDVKVRYRAKSVKATLEKNGRLIFKKPERAITPGQSAVFYQGRKLLGGGIIV